MDRSNLSHLQAMRPDDFGGHLGLFLAFDRDQSLSEVPDPYYGGHDGFESVLDMVEAAGQSLLEAISRNLR